MTVGNYFNALGIFYEMKKAGIKALEQGKDIHNHVTESKLETNEVVMGALLEMYAI